jgi:hypothetical protein
MHYRVCVVVAGRGSVVSPDFTVTPTYGRHHRVTRSPKDGVMKCVHCRHRIKAEVLPSGGQYWIHTLTGLERCQATTVAEPEDVDVVD